MQYKLLIVKNRTTEKTNLKTYLDWFKINTPIEIVTEEISTDFDVVSQTVGNSSFGGVICSEDIIPKLKTVVPEGKYNAVVLYVGNNLNGIRVSVCNGKDGKFNLYPDTELIQLRTISDGGKDLNHELHHAFFAKLRRNGINLQDPMDTYILNNEMVVDSVVNTNREMALQLLKPYWDKITSLKIKTMNTYIWFKDTEYTNADKTHTFSELVPELKLKLDKMRGESGFAWKIVSGYRTISENAKLANSVPDSAHTIREAVDIYCIDDIRRQRIIDIARANGITRIGIAKTFIHLDISKTLPQNVTWLYN